MADIRWKERSLITLEASGASFAANAQAAAGTALDVRAGGNAAGDMQAQFELVCQWATITGIVKGTVAARLYLMPKLDGTNAPSIDSSAGAYLPTAAWAGNFEVPVAPTANTNLRLITGVVDLAPRLYTAHLLNSSGQAISAGWTLKVVSEQAQTV